MRWNRHIDRSKAAEHYAREFDIHPLTAQILLNRGVNGIESMRRFLQPDLHSLHDPFLIKGMEAAVRRIRRALVKNERIHIHGDYDVDGISATSVLVLGLRALGADVHYHIINRADAAVGLSLTSLRRDHLPHRPTILLTVDCGTSSNEAIEEAQRNGIDVIVVDHHHPGRTLPKCCALLNPQLPRCDFPFPDLSAVGVAFNLVHALEIFLSRDDRAWPAIRAQELLDLVALGTVADVVPLVDENRYFVREGLRLIRSGRRPGICALMRAAGLISEEDDQSGLEDRLNARTIGFRIAPLINAAGRMDDANKCVELLTTDQYRVADRIATELEGWNVRRQGCERDVLEDAVKQASAQIDEGMQVIVLAEERWHPGVLGIVANRLMERYNRPAVVAGIDASQLAKGSVRSPGEFDMLAALSQCRDLLETFGGHKVAAGVAFKATNLSELRRRLDLAVKGALPQGHVPEPTIHIDATVAFDDLDERVVQELRMLAPFGAGNPEPLLEARRVRTVHARVVNGNSLRIRFRQGTRQAEAWGYGLSARLIDTKNTVDIVFSPRMGKNGREPVIELVLKDLHLTPPNDESR